MVSDNLMGSKGQTCQQESEVGRFYTRDDVRSFPEVCVLISLVPIGEATASFRRFLGYLLVYIADEATTLHCLFN